MLVENINDEIIVTDNIDNDYDGYAVIDVPRVTFPGKENINGATYTKESYQEEIQSEYIKELMDSGNFECEFEVKNYNNICDNYRINKDLACGKIIKITDSIIRIKISKFNKFYNEIIRLSDENKLGAFMIYLGELSNKDKKLYIITQIIKFTIGDLAEYNKMKAERMKK